jgi:hypothetical protein
VRFALLLLCCPLFSQSLRVYSEFAGIDANGDVTAPAQPREILSPAIVRNGFTSFQVVVTIQPGMSYWLYVGQNPDDAVRVTMYLESGSKLDPVDMPYEGKSTQVFWMDLWTARDAAVRRVKVEPQLKVNDLWIEYPMEARVMDAVVPASGHSEAWAKCTAALKVRPSSEPSRSALHYRNAQQDAALARSLPPADLERTLKTCEPPSANPEWYLKIRDYLFRMR